MAATIDATVGGSSANSYVELSEFNDYLDARPFATTTDAAGRTDDEKTRALIAAAKRIDQEEFAGTKASAIQALKWPRVGAKDDDGRTYPSDTIPQVVKDAQCELAIAYLTADGDAWADTGLGGFEFVQVGPLQVRPRQGQAAGELPENVRRLLMPVLATSRVNFRLLRA